MTTQPTPAITHRSIRSSAVKTLLATLCIAVLSGCAKKPSITLRSSRNPMPTTPNTAPVTAERQQILSDLDPVWATRTNLARMYDGTQCFYLLRTAGSTGVATRANTQAIVVRLGNRSGSRGADTDRDGISDVAEQRIGTNPNNADTDGDTIPDAFEVFGSGTSPVKADSNDNGMPDNVEFPLDDPNAYADSDGDGLLNGQEVAHFSSNPNSLNSDGDMLNDDDEVLLGTNVGTADTDSDGDGEPDAFEMANGSDPMSGASEPSDADGDNIPDFLDPDDAETAMVTGHAQTAVAACVNGAGIGCPLQEGTIRNTSL